MPNIQSAAITIMVSDMDKSIAFYAEVLGFKVKSRYGNHWADLEIPGLHIGLHPTDKPIAKGENMQIGLKVSDLDETVKELETKGIQFTFNPDDQVNIATFQDPDGNTLYFIKADW
ncbi:MAG: VOC family protein [Bacteroidetes bacterium]|nr:MAG: VOC family protein [Bacteroidota bacterium]